MKIGTVKTQTERTTNKMNTLRVRAIIHRKTPFELVTKRTHTKTFMGQSLMMKEETLPWTWRTMSSPKAEKVSSLKTTFLRGFSKRTKIGAIKTTWPSSRTRDTSMSMSDN